MDMIERVAKAIWGGDDDEWATLAPWYADQYRDAATAALKALREPTSEMVEAGHDACDWTANAEPIWQAMIDTALAGEGKAQHSRTTGNGDGNNG